MPVPTLGVVIPTKNSMKYLPEHLAGVAEWIDLAKQVVVVDSFSTDGTVEFIKENLRHPGLQIVQHPPGLYASWNHGIRQLTTEYCYISTVGDALTRAGAEHFVAAAVRFQCDVLISRPHFLDEAGRPHPAPNWPVEDIINTLQLKESCRLSPALLTAYALTCSGNALTSTCASDLFRTAVLQQYPFPLDFGTAGDTGWSQQNAGRLKWAISVEKVSTFRIHPPTATSEEVKTAAQRIDYFKTAAEAVDVWLAGPRTDFERQIIARIRRLPLIHNEVERAQQQYQRYRKNRVPWILNPAAWRARRLRNELRRDLSGGRDNIFRDAHLGPA